MVSRGEITRSLGQKLDESRGLEGEYSLLQGAHDQYHCTLGSTN